ncbi:ABC transporter ATP-binding protein [Raoultibacter phocaeensis]|uniref:ABC transporter ATP-binding protein n=1 Tax=Raoultibacter phocaeensis TaxID=2479841 RepID=UPI0015D5A6B0|nr:ABC transporter ATP-binding protein [Raoultibacter phocaeensis]
MRLTVSNITIDLGGKSAKRVLDDVSFTAQEGEFLSLLGESGAGKSTLLKIIAGILVQDRGSVAFGDASVDEVPAHKRNVGYVFQDMRLFPNMNVEENVAFPCKMRGMKKAERLARARELLAHVQLEGFGARDVSSLSGGQQQRVALARALAGTPKVLLLDEPFSGLDEHLRDDMRSLVLKLHREFGTTTIMVTHDAIEAIEMSERIVYMSAGRVMQRGAPDELFERPATSEIAACFGDCSTLAGEVRHAVFVADTLRLPAPGVADGPATAVIRQSAVRLDPCAEAVHRVRCCVYRGEINLVRIDLAGQTLTVPVCELVSAGAKVGVACADEGVFVYGGEDAGATSVEDRTGACDVESQPVERGAEADMRAGAEARLGRTSRAEASDVV